MKRRSQLYTLDDREEVLHRVKHHPFGIAPLVGGATILVGAGVVAMFMSDSLVENTAFPVSQTGLNLFIAGILVLVGLLTFVAVIVYFRSQLIVTNESIIEINQHSLFARDVSQLSLANVQEVTVKQSGLLPYIFDYGTVTLETAGEKANFRFDRAPDPYRVSRVIYDAHEQFIETHPEFTNSR